MRASKSSIFKHLLQRRSGATKGRIYLRGARKRCFAWVSKRRLLLERLAARTLPESLQVQVLGKCASRIAVAALVWTENFSVLHGRTMNLSVCMASDAIPDGSAGADSESLCFINQMQLWSLFSPFLVPFWSHFGPILVPFWSGAEDFWSTFWSGFGPAKEFWSIFWSTT